MSSRFLSAFARLTSSFSLLISLLIEIYLYTSPKTPQFSATAMRARHIPQTLALSVNWLSCFLVFISSLLRSKKLFTKLFTMRYESMGKHFTATNGCLNQRSPPPLKCVILSKQPSLYNHILLQLLTQSKHNTALLPVLFIAINNYIIITFTTIILKSITCLRQSASLRPRPYQHTRSIS